jgi:hypothetical protein
MGRIKEDKAYSYADFLEDYNTSTNANDLQIIIQVDDTEPIKQKHEVNKYISNYKTLETWSNKTSDTDTSKNSNNKHSVQLNSSDEVVRDKLPFDQDAVHGDVNKNVPYSGVYEKMTQFFSTKNGNSNKTSLTTDINMHRNYLREKSNPIPSKIIDAISSNRYHYSIMEKINDKLDLLNHAYRMNLDIASLFYVNNVSNVNNFHI